MKRIEFRGRTDKGEGEVLGPFECEMLVDGEVLGGVVSMEIKAGVSKEEIPTVRISFETMLSAIDFRADIPLHHSERKLT